MVAPLPENERERVERLRQYAILDTPAEPRFDRIARLAARLLACPIALVSLVDDRRQWFKARVGLDATETPREDAFCAHAILQDDVMVVSDASTDPRFLDNPLVRGEPKIRFYAGAPLWVGDGLSMGTLCVIDREPRELDEHGRACLEDLATLVVEAMEHHQRIRHLESTQRELSSTHEELEAISFAIGHDMRAPLRQMGALLELFEAEHAGELSAHARQELDDIRRIRGRADEAIRGMTELVRLPQGGPLDVESADLEPVLRELAQTMAALYPGLGTDFAAPKRPVHGHPLLLRQMLQHLVDNGFKHGARNVRIEVEFSERRCQILVLDDGPGIPAEQAETIFEPFRRLVPKSVPGSGVGLTVVRKIVRLHGGTVRLDTDRIGGSAFVVSLPQP
jgi:signal transduction histidine kinase